MTTAYYNIYSHGVPLLLKQSFENKLLNREANEDKPTGLPQSQKEGRDVCLSDSHSWALCVHAGKTALSRG